MVSFSTDIHNKQVIIVSLSSMMRSLGMGASWPFMAIFLSLYLHIAIYIVGIIFTLLSLMSMIFSILGGYLADLKGRKFTLMLGSVSGIFIFLSIAITFLFHAYALTIILFILSSFSGSLVYPSASALISDVTEPENREGGYSIYRILSNIGWAIGPLMGSFIYSSGIVYIFYALVIANLLQTIIISFVKKQNVMKTGTGTKNPFLVYDKYLFIFSIATFFIILLSSQFSVSLPLYSEIVIKINVSDIGYIYAINGLVVVLGQYPLIKLFSRFGDLTTFIAGALFYALGYFIIAFSTNLYGLMFDMVIITIGENLTTPTINSVISKMSPAGKTGRYMGFNAMFNSIGRAFGPSVGTYVMYTFHYNGLITWSLIGVFGVFSAIVIVIFSSSYKKSGYTYIAEKTKS
ncbi:MAG: multidrug efflux permease [Ferroplasma sp. Type II]|jgi:MFS family permease|uniref:MDR family MFS transporter n=1 Tax=Ferroplasma sp. Type II TaxID=261388 RepID=UPI0003895D59|nr:MFS transporter [Ferroplasma sp. Type II]EQB73618.1 MAG: multidrug efflux permease [Ferroplasma sp. Type II]HIH59859.1 MFS transporter [Ferroplasma sp.]HII82587.1 MFS transporter [Ferroplasma sp.]